MRKDKEGLHKLLDFAADITIEVGRKFVENQIGIGLAEPTASLLSPKQFREFVIPYYVKVMDKWKEWGSRGSGFHICGDTTKLLATNFPSWEMSHQLKFCEALRNLSNRLSSTASANAGTTHVDSRLLLDVMFRFRHHWKTLMLI